MKGVLAALKSNAGTVAGVVGGFYVAGTIVAQVNSMLTPVLGAKNAKFGQAAAAGAVTALAFFGATKVKGEFLTDALVGFGAVAMGHAVQGLVGALTASS